MGSSFNRKLVSFMRNQVRQRNEANALKLSTGTDCRRSLGIIRLYLLTRENQVDRSPGGGRSRLHQHVHSRHVPVPQSERIDGARDPFEIFAAYRDIDIPREAPGVRLRFFT